MIKSMMFSNIGHIFRYTNLTEENMKRGAKMQIPL